METPAPALGPPLDASPKLQSKITVSDLARLSGVSTQGIRAAIAGNSLRAKQLVGGRWSIRLDDAIAWMESRAALLKVQAERAEEAIARARAAK